MPTSILIKADFNASAKLPNYILDLRYKTFSETRILWQHNTNKHRCDKPIHCHTGNRHKGRLPVFYM